MPDVILTGLADESSASKRVEEQLAVTRALGLRYYSPRFLDLGSGVKNAMALTDDEVDRLVKLHEEFEVQVSSLASPIGKVKLLDVDDGTQNAFIPFEQYLAGDVAHAISLAQRLGARLIRGFSFYPPRNDDPWIHVRRAAEKLRAIADACAAADLYFGLEVEGGLVGRDGELERALWDTVAHDHLGLVFDGGNLTHQGKSGDAMMAQWKVMKPGLLWMHVKDYRRANGEASAVPADLGDANHRGVFADLKASLPAISKRLAACGLPGLFVDLEPHLKGGGQFGGFSGPDGYGVALRGLLRVLDETGVTYELLGFGDWRA